MAADGTATHHPSPRTTAASVPVQGVRRRRLSPTGRIVRQVQAIDAWVAARREHEQAHQGQALNRDEQMYLAREVEVLRRTHDTIKGRCARQLSADPEPMVVPRPTAVIAHRHAWYVDELALLLGAYGVTVLLGTDNGAEALGAVVAEQPDLVLVGDRLAMVHGPALLAEVRRYAPDALLAVQASDAEAAQSLQAAADSVFLRQHSPAAMADALVAALHATTGDPR